MINELRGVPTTEKSIKSPTGPLLRLDSVFLLLYSNEYNCGGNSDWLPVDVSTTTSHLITHAHLMTSFVGGNNDYPTHCENERRYYERHTDATAVNITN